MSSRFLPTLALLASLLCAAGLHAAAPAAPSGLVAAAGTGTIGLNWTDTSGAATYRIYEASSASGPWTLLATRDRSRHLVANAPAASARYFRVTAVNSANEESAVSATVSATANALSLDRPATAGHFRIGSSFVTDSDRFQRFLSARGINVPTRRFQVIGSPLEYMWSNTLANNPSTFATEITQLQSGSYDVLVMNAQTPFLQGERELDGTLLFAEEALAANPDYRVFIHEYWMGEYYYNPWNEDFSNRKRHQQWYRLASVALAYEATQILGTPVYIAPIGTAVEAAKTAAINGDLDITTSREAFNKAIDNAHLSELGKYLQEGVAAAGAYQIDVRGTHNWVDSSTTLTANDAAILQQIIHDTVRNTPFSGWHDGAPTNLAAYLQALRDALRIRESFDHFTATGSGSVANPINGLTWAFTGVNSYTDGGSSPIVYDFPQTSRLTRKLRLNAGGTLSTTLPRGLSAFSLRLAQVSGGDATLQVKANGNTVATFTNASTILYGREVANLALGGNVTLLLTNTGTGVIELDDLIWDEPPVSPSGLSILNDDLIFFAHQQALSRQLAASGGSGSYTWSVASGSLPVGLSLSASGLLSGTPTTLGQSFFTLRITDTTDGAKTADRTYQSTVVANTAIGTHPQSQTVQLGDPVSFTVSAVGTNLIYEWYRDGTLLPGSNAPTYTIANASALDAGDYTVKVIGSGGTVTSNPAILTVDTGDAEVLTTVFNGTNQNLAGNTFDLTNLGSNPIVLTGALQGNFNAAPGLVVTAYTRSGTANGFASSSSGWTLWGVSDSFTGLGYGNATGYTLKSGGNPATVTIAPGATLGVYLIITTGGRNIAYSGSSTTYTSGNLRLTPQQGLGFGSIFAANLSGPSRLFNGAITFYEDTAPVINPAALATGTLGVAYSRTFTAPGGNGVPVWQLSGSLPNGLSFNTTTGQLTGPPTQAGTYNLTLTATDTDGDADTEAFSLTVTDPFVTWLTDAGLPANTDPDTTLAADPTGPTYRTRHVLGLSPTQPADPNGTLTLSSDSPLYTFTRDTNATGHLIRIQYSTTLLPDSWLDAHLFHGADHTEFDAFIQSDTDLGSGLRETTLQFAPLTDRLFIRTKIEPYSTP